MRMTRTFTNEVEITSVELHRFLKERLGDRLPSRGSYKVDITFEPPLHGSPVAGLPCIRVRWEQQADANPYVPGQEPMPEDD